ncbi:hypothetical protein ACJRO7_030687 [Eucalyptus globulus]|uniref:Uncharacterized protein n=1 Tax=Eucalyptus globulus TaxID=34317 RepID=A0ABD3JHD2_EUCGL
MPNLTYSKSMNLSSLSMSIPILLLLPLFYHICHCQNPYPRGDQFNCSSPSSEVKGYLCNSPQACQSFVTFRCISPYDTPLTIASLLGSDALDIATVNNLKSTTENIPSDNLVVVPVSCHCSGSIYQHQASYIVANSERYFTIANSTYQGLSLCRALLDQNYYAEADLVAGAHLLVPLRCACLSTNQTVDGVKSLLTYSVTVGETIVSIAERYGITAQHIVEANMVTDSSVLYAFTPIIVPLNCAKNSKSSFCYYSLNCMPDQKKFPFKLVLVIGAAIGIGLLGLSVCRYCLYRYLRKQRDKIVKETLFRQNGGLLLKQKFSPYGRDGGAAIFSEEDLQRATDNYSKSRILGQGGFGTVYKGMLPDGSIVAVKKSKNINRGQIEQFINEVVVLSQVNHRNIVKLIGCCLETNLPLLVYEFIPNGTISQHIHWQDKDCSLSWEDPVAYTHSAASLPIYHRDIKRSNILLDDNNTAKVSDFGTSRPVPSDKTHLTTAVQGTFGYLDPEYFRSSQFTDKSDVYSFGVVLVELLTGQKPTSSLGDDEGTHLVASFILLMKKNKLSEILDPVVANEANAEDVLAVAMLAMGCLRLNGRKRPTMRVVAMELEGLRKSQSFSLTSQNRYLFEDGLPSDDNEESIYSASVSLKIESISI